MPRRSPATLLSGVSAPIVIAALLLAATEAARTRSTTTPAVPAAPGKGSATKPAPSPAAMATPAAEPATPATGLKLDNPAPGQTSGEFRWLGRSVKFVAFTDGRREASARLTYVARSLVAIRKLPDGLVTLDGNGALVDAPAREILGQLARALEERLEPWKGSVTPEQDLLVRATLWWSEAPAGTVLETAEIDRPKRERVPEPPPAKGAKKVEPPCDRDDEDDVELLPGGCRFGTYSDICHDAGPKPHCWRCETPKAGCDRASDCLGRCGPGCGSTGSGIYARDCADLDACCRDHGACEGKDALLCRDEWQEAANDVFFGPVNCLTTGC